MPFYIKTLEIDEHERCGQVASGKPGWTSLTSHPTLPSSATCKAPPAKRHLQTPPANATCELSGIRHLKMTANFLQ